MSGHFRNAHLSRAGQLYLRSAIVRYFVPRHTSEHRIRGRSTPSRALWMDHFSEQGAALRSYMMRRCIPYRRPSGVPALLPFAAPENMRCRAGAAADFSQVATCVRVSFGTVLRYAGLPTYIRWRLAGSLATSVLGWHGPVGRSSPASPRLAPSRPVLPCPVPSCPVLSCPVPSRPVLSCPVPSYAG